MDAAVKFRVILDHEIKKLCLPGIPCTVQELEAAVKQVFGISVEISLQHKDPDFITLCSTDDLKDKDTLKIVYAPSAVILTNIDFTDLPRPDCSASTLVSENDSAPQTSSEAILEESDDTIELSPHNPGTHKPWPTDFPISKFSYNTEVVLQKGHENFLRDGSLLCKERFYPGVKLNILECLAEVIFSYTPYPNDAQRCAIAETLIKQHPCLKERWPALFKQSQINEKFLGINGVLLEPKFMSQLDKHNAKLLSLFNAKGGAVGQRIKSQMLALIQNPSACVVKRREVVLRCLMEYMGERQEDLISDHHSHDETEVHAELSRCPMKIYVCHQLDVIGIIIEGHHQKHDACSLDLPMPWKLRAYSH
ncbi:uncharacterized protein LOC143483317 [Brachyhypopomus gauderio]|uniref:uncharacterized protein LOC143483317 n=1 Tax=Brachyhypopomus gauderio TaxID=698409 RepID=UPI004042988B